MSVPSNALVHQNDSRFAQQGSVDWVALSQVPYNATVAVIGRLAKAGVDALTVRFGQAMCSQIPIGSRGEEVLRKAMSTLKAKSVAHEVLWFGVGVRHVLQDLIQTSQGCSLVALCAALSEAHSMSVAALVLYEMAKECGGPAELSPSYTQWLALVSVASPVFNTTTFGLRINQIMRLGERSVSKASMDYKNGHPKDLAKVILDIGQVALGKLQTITIQGPWHCSWVAAWADYVLRLRVLVLDINGEPIYSSYDNTKESAQVIVQFTAEKTGSKSSLSIVGKCHVIRSGQDFIRDCFLKDMSLQLDNPEIMFSGGRVQWQTMLTETFGNTFTSLIQMSEGQLNCHPSPLGTANEQTHPHLASPTMTPEKTSLFTRMFAAAVFILIDGGVEFRSHPNAESYVHRACECIPELFPIKDVLMQAIGNVRADSKTTSLMRIYQEARLGLGELCHCSTCLTLKGSNYSCNMMIAEVVIYLTTLLDRLVLDTPIRPTAHGLRSLSLYDMSRTPEFRESIDTSTQSGLFNLLTRRLKRVEKSDTQTLSMYARLFAGEQWDSIQRYGPAQSDGKVYCYIGTLEHFTDDLNLASTVHVGSGAIEYRSRLYNCIYDETWFRPDERIIRPVYPVRQAEEVENISALLQDTTDKSISTKVLIEERPTGLYFWHEIVGGPCQVVIPPSMLLNGLKTALSYQLRQSSDSADVKPWYSVYSRQRYTLLHGEGQAPVECSQLQHVLRPHRGNTVGRCMALLHSRDRAALVRNNEELELFDRFWIRTTDEDRAEIANHYYLIS